MYIGYYIFGVGHKERHYLKNPRGTAYKSAITRNPAQARHFQTAVDAESAVRNFLHGKKGADSMIPGAELVDVSMLSEV